MAFTRELDELRQEIRLSENGTLTFWPKVKGLGNVIASSATATIYDPSNNILESADVTISTVATTNSRVDVTVTAIDTLGEDCRCRIAWAYSGTTYVDHVYFDVVMHPLGAPATSYNDMLEERPDCQDVLERLGSRLGYSDAKDYAEICAYRARVEMEAWLRDAISQQQNTLIQTGTVGNKSFVPGRPHLLLNRERLTRVERKLTMRAMYEADMEGDPDGVDTSASLYRHYSQAATDAFKSVGPLKFDYSQDLRPDETITNVAKSRTLRRRQG